jgi:hypothetical protein
MSKRVNGKPLWWVRPIVNNVIHEDNGHIFTGTETEMVAHIGKMHRETGIPHAAVSVGAR